MSWVEDELVIVTIDTGSTLSVGGESTLLIDELDGTIDLLDGAEIKNSAITSGGTLRIGTHEEGEPEEEVTVGNNVTFSGTNEFSADIENEGFITVDGEMTAGNITNDGSITLNSTLSAAGISGGKVTISVEPGFPAVNMLTVTGAGTISNVELTVEAPGATVSEDVAVIAHSISDSTINLIISDESLAGLADEYQYVRTDEMTGVTFTVNGGDVSELQEVMTDYLFTTRGNTGAWLVKEQSRETLYVKSTYSASGDNDGHIYGWNAFADNSELVFAAETTMIVYSANNAEDAYDALNLGTVDNAPASLTITTSGNEVTMGPLTVGSNTRNQTVTFSGAHMSLKDESISETTTASLTVSSGSTLNIGGASASDITAETIVNNGSITLTANTSAPALKAGTIANSGTITVDASAYTSGTVKVIDVDSMGDFSMSGIVAQNLRAGAVLIQKTDGDDAGDIFITEADFSSLYVNRAWAGEPYCKKVGDGLYVGVNAFADNSALAFVPGAEATTIVYSANNAEDAYAALNLGILANAPVKPNGITITTAPADELDLVTMGSLTVGNYSTGVNQTVTLSGANMSLAGITNYSTITVSNSDSAASVVTADAILNDAMHARIELTGSTLSAGLISNNAMHTRLTLTDSTLSANSISNNASNTHLTLTGSTLGVTDDIYNIGTVTVLDSGTTASVVTAGSISNITISSQVSVTGSTLGVTDDIYNIGIVTVLDSDTTASVVTAGSIRNDSAGASTTITGSTLGVTNRIFNVGTITFGKSDSGASSVVTAGSISNDSLGASTTVTGSTLSVANDIFNVGTIAATAGSTVSAGSITNEPSVSAPRIEVTDSTLNVSAVTVNKGTFSVAGVSTLNIGNLSGTIRTSADDTTLKDSSISGGAIDVLGYLTFSNSDADHANTLNGVTLTLAVAGKIIKNADTLVLGNASTASVTSLMNGDMSNHSARMTVTASTVSTANSISNFGTFSANTGVLSANLNIINGVQANSGASMTITASTVSATQGISNYGTFSATTGSTVSAGSSISNYGTFSATDGSTVNVNSILNTTSGASISVTDSTFSVTNAVQNTGGASISVTDSTFSANAVANSGTFTVAGESTLNIGNLIGTIQANNGATIRNSTVGGTVKVQSGATVTLDGMSSITTLDLSEAANVTIDWQDQLSFTGFGDSYEKKLTIKVDSFTSGDLSTPILDYTGDTVLTDADATAMYQLLLTNAWSSTQGSSTQYEFVVRDGDLYIDLKKIVVKDGTYSTITALNGVEAVIQRDEGTTEFTRAVYGGTEVVDTDSVTRSTNVSIETGTFDRFFVGGNNIAMPDKDTPYTVTAKTDPENGDILPQSVAISDGSFTAIVATGDRVQKGAFTLNSDMEMNIGGGQFDYIVAGGLLNSLYENTGEVEQTNGTADIHGNVFLNITGGVFADDCWIYGGCVSTSRSVSSYASTIYGDVTVTVDCGTGNTIQLSHLVAGSHGLGQILEDSTTNSGGNTAIVFKGTGTNLSFTATGELWGGSGRDNLNARTGICQDSFVEFDRLLSFEGFIGDLNCTKIRDFSSIELIGESHVNLTESTVDLKGIENWTFGCDSSLSGSFGNDFEDDILNLNGFTALGSGTSKTLMTVADGDGSAFSGFRELGSVLLEGVGTSVGKTGETDLETCWYWGTSDSHTFELYLDNNGTTTSMILAKC